MFAQHVLAVLKPDGIGATVMPHGVLFRGGEEKEIRTGHHRGGPPGSGDRPGPEPLLRHRHPGLHPGAARHRLRDAAERSGKVLFINADREFTAGRAQNYLGPAARREDRLRLPRVRATSPASPASWTSPSWRENDFNLNIRRYVDNTPPPEPQDVRAHLHGGVPRGGGPRPCRAGSPRTASTSHALFGRPNGRVATATSRHAAGRASVDQIPALAAPTGSRAASRRSTTGGRRHVKHIIELPDDQTGDGHPQRTCSTRSSPRWSRWACWTGTSSPG